jgi:hypothetical protein
MKHRLVNSGPLFSRSPLGLPDHKHITTTQIYDKRRRSVKDSASHKMPL